MKLQMGLSRENLIHSIFTARPKAVNARIYKIKTSTRKCRRLRFDAMSYERGQLLGTSPGVTDWTFRLLDRSYKAARTEQVGSPFRRLLNAHGGAETVDRCCRSETDRPT